MQGPGVRVSLAVLLVTCMLDSANTKPSFPSADHVDPNSHFCLGVSPHRGPPKSGVGLSMKATPKACRKQQVQESNKSAQLRAADANPTAAPAINPGKSNALRCHGCTNVVARHNMYLAQSVGGLSIVVTHNHLTPPDEERTWNSPNFRRTEK